MAGILNVIKAEKIINVSGFLKQTRNKQIRIFLLAGKDTAVKTFGCHIFSCHARLHNYTLKPSKIRTSTAFESFSQKTEIFSEVFSFRINIAMLQMTLYLFPLPSKFVMRVKISSHVFSSMSILAGKKIAPVKLITLFKTKHFNQIKRSTTQNFSYILTWYIEYLLADSSEAVTT